MEAHNKKQEKQNFEPVNKGFQRHVFAELQSR